MTIVEARELLKAEIKTPDNLYRHGVLPDELREAVAILLREEERLHHALLWIDNYTPLGSPAQQRANAALIERTRS